MLPTGIAKVGNFDFAVLRQPTFCVVERYLVLKIHKQVFCGFMLFIACLFLSSLLFSLHFFGLCFYLLFFESF